MVKVEAKDSTSAGCISQPRPAEALECLGGSSSIDACGWVKTTLQESFVLSWCCLSSILLKLSFHPTALEKYQKDGFWLPNISRHSCTIFLFLLSYYPDSSIESMNFKSRWLLNNTSPLFQQWLQPLCSQKAVLTEWIQTLGHNIVDRGQQT